jgi:hypothetical protein
MSCAVCGKFWAEPALACPSCRTNTTGTAACEAIGVAVVPVVDSAPLGAKPEPSVGAQRPAGPVGIGGWLTLPAIGLVLMPILTMGYVLKDLLPYFMPEVWLRLTDESSDGFHPLWAPTLIFALVANTILIVGSIVVAVAFFQKRAQVPRWVIGLYLFELAATVIEYLLMRSIPDLSAGAGRDLVKTVLRTIIWVAYFTSSVRVKNTFVR